MNLVLAVVFIFASFIGGIALAQQQPREVDPRLAAQMVQALQSMITLREAQLKAMAEDTEKRIAELMAKCGDPCKPPKEQAEKKE